MWPWHHRPTPILMEGPWEPLLLTTLKRCLWRGVPREERKPDKENNKPRIGDCNSGSRCPPAPWGDSEGFSPAHQSLVLPPPP